MLQGECMQTLALALSHIGRYIDEFNEESMVGKEMEIIYLYTLDLLIASSLRALIDDVRCR